VASLGLDVTGFEAAVAGYRFDDALGGDDLAGPGFEFAPGSLGELEVDALAGQATRRGVATQISAPSISRTLDLIDDSRSATRVVGPPASSRATTPVALD
jgi:hypothetical protein